MAENVARTRNRANAQPSGVSGWLHSHLSGESARFMRPRLVFILVCLGLMLFGVMMAYSAGSMDGFMREGFNPQGYFGRQAAFALAAIAIAALFVRVVNYEFVTTSQMLVAYGLMAILLLGITRLGLGDLEQNEMGATRTLNLYFFSLQPTELFKPLFVYAGATLLDRYFVMRDIELREFGMLLVICIFVPLVLVFLQPDKGSTLIILATLVAMLLLTGFDRRVILGLGAVLLLAILGVSWFVNYSSKRIAILAADIWDPVNLQDLTYQVAHGLSALATGGVFGAGIGMSKMKYGHLSQSNTDLVFTVIGEETGFVGCMLVIAAFVVLLWAGLKIAEAAPDNRSRLIAAGGALMIFIQAFVNICGVLVITPLTGKPLPFLTYGGSSMIGMGLLMGMILNISFASKEPETEYDRRRADFSVTAGAASLGDGSVGEVTPRSERPAGVTASVPLAGARRSGRLTVLGGGADDERDRSSRDTGRNTGPTSPASLRREREMRENRGGRGRVSVDPSSGRKRIDLGPDAGERLRSRRDGRRDR